MPRNNGKQVIALQVDDLDALILDIMAARKRMSRSALLEPIVLDLVNEHQNALEDQGILVGGYSALKAELQTELEIWKSELERDGKMVDCRELTIRALVNSARKSRSSR